MYVNPELIGSNIMFDILSLNVRGIREKKKRINILSWVRNYVPDKGIIMLQETHSTGISKTHGHYKYSVRKFAICMERAMPEEC